MQEAEIKTSSTASNKIQKKQQPFFNKEGEGSFFSKPNESSQPFFSSNTIQPKLTIGQPNDKYEVEADAMADKVVQRLSEPKTTTANNIDGGNNSIQRKCSACDEEEKLQKKEDTLAKNISHIQRKPIFESNDDQPKADVQTKTETSIQTPSLNIQSRLSFSKGGGSSMSSDTQNSMGSAFGADFTGVKVHTGNNAVQMNQELGAQAFTHGNDIYFNEGKYNTNSTSGKHLLAHELTHTVQQGYDNSIIQRSPLSEELQRIWNTGNKGQFFDRLRGVSQPDSDLNVMVNSLTGDDLWLAQTIQTNGPEPLWSSALISERQRKATTNNWPSEPGHIKGTLATTAQGRSVNAYFFPGITDNKALIIGGVHGSELSAIEVVESLLEQLRTGPRPYFSVIIVPRLFPDNAALAETSPRAVGSTANIGRNSCDTNEDNCSGTNRGMPEGGHAHTSTNPRDVNNNTIEAENIALLELINRFRPTRIASIHAVRRLATAGIYADPRTDSTGTALGYDTDNQLALEMTRHARAEGANVPGNQLGNDTPNTVYPRDPDVVPRGTNQPRDTTAGYSLGGWGTTAICNPSISSNNRPAMRVITVEVQTSKRVQDLGAENSPVVVSRRAEIDAHVSSLREIFLGSSVTDNPEAACLNVNAPQEETSEK